MTPLWYRLADLDSESAAKQFEVVHRATLSVHINVVALNSSSLDEASFRCHTVDPLYWIKPDTYPRNFGEMDGAHIKNIFPTSVHINVVALNSSLLNEASFRCHTLDPLYWILPDTSPRISGEMDGATLVLVFHRTTLSLHINVHWTPPCSMKLHFDVTLWILCIEENQIPNQGTLEKWMENNLMKRPYREKINIVAQNSASLDEPSFQCHTVDPLYWIELDTYPRSSWEMDWVIHEMKNLVG